MTYLLFAYEKYYPRGGFNDFQGSFISIENAKAWLLDKFTKEDVCWEHWQIVNADTFEIVESDL